MADVWTPDQGPGIYDFETGTFTPAAETPAEQAGGLPPFPGGPTFAEVWDAEHAETAPEFVVYGTGEAAGAAEDFGFGPVDPAEADAIAVVMSSLLQAGEEEQAAADEAAGRQEAPAEQGPEQEDQPEPEAADETPARPAPDVESVRLAAEEIGMLEALKAWVAEELKAAKERHAPLHADAANIGGTKTIPLKIDGKQIGTYNIAEPTRKVVFDDAAVLAFVEAHSKHNVYEVVDGGRAVQYGDVLEYIRLTHPDLIKREVRAAFLTVLKGEVDERGRVVAEDTGELITVAKWVNVESDGSGRCGWKRPKNGPTGREQLVQAWKEGRFKPRGALGDGLGDGNLGGEE